MLLGRSALLEIMALFQEGIVKGEDISAKLRQLDLDIEHDIPAVEGGKNPDVGRLVLSEKYIEEHPRAPFWNEN